MDEQITNGANTLLQYGALGVFCLFLIITSWMLWHFMQKMVKEFLKRVDRFTDVMEKHAVNEAQQTEAIRSLKDVMQTLKINSG